MEERRRKKDVLKRWMEGVDGGRDCENGQRWIERGQMNHMEIKCVWERVNKKRGEKYGIEGNV